jgi:hypothetical protein
MRASLPSSDAYNGLTILKNALCKICEYALTYLQHKFVKSVKTISLNNFTFRMARRTNTAHVMWQEIFLGNRYFAKRGDVNITEKLTFLSPLFKDAVCS